MCIMKTFSIPYSDSNHICDFGYVSDLISQIHTLSSYKNISRDVLSHTNLGRIIVFFWFTKLMDTKLSIVDRWELFKFYYAEWWNLYKKSKKYRGLLIIIAADFYL